MTPGKYNIDWYRGDSEAFRVILYEDTDQTPSDLTGATVKAEIRDKSAGTKIVELTTTITLPNIVDIAMTPTMYTDCPAKGVWDLQITFADGQVHTPLAGTVTITADVTDSAPMVKVAR